MALPTRIDPCPCYPLLLACAPQVGAATAFAFIAAIPLSLFLMIWRTTRGWGGLRLFFYSYILGFSLWPTRW